MNAELGTTKFSWLPARNSTSSGATWWRAGARARPPTGIWLASAS